MKATGLTAIGSELRKKPPRSDVKDIIQNLTDELILSNDALIEARKKLEEKEKEIAALRDESGQKAKTLSYAYGILWAVPLVSIATVVVGHILPIRICTGLSCATTGTASLPDLVQVALITGSLVLIITLMVALLRAVHPAKSPIDGLGANSSISEIVAAAVKQVTGKS